MKNVQNTLLKMPPEELLAYLSQEFYVPVPMSVESVDELQTAGVLLGRCAANYAYLINQAMLAKLIKRSLKQEKAPKSDVDDALSREEIFTMFADVSKTTYNAISRMITVRAQAAEELKMGKYTT